MCIYACMDLCLRFMGFSIVFLFPLAGSILGCGFLVLWDAMDKCPSLRSKTRVPTVVVVMIVFANLASMITLGVPAACGVAGLWFYGVVTH